MEIRVCTKCGEEKPATKEFFYKREGGRLGLRADCKVCCCSRVRRYHKENKETIAAKAKRYYEKNREKHNAHSKRYREEHPEKIAEYQKRWREEHKEEIARYMKRYRKNQPAAIYKIANKATDKIYIGATTMFYKRCGHHKSDLRKGIHKNQALQEDYNKYGLDVFEFEMIEEHPCDTEFKILEKIEEKTIKRLLIEGKELYNKQNTKL